jgi:plastocyanin
MRRSTLSRMCLVAMLVLGLAAPMATAGDHAKANATVSFGAWQTDPPLDRFPTSSPPDGNEHRVIPHQVNIKAGGAVNFIISGLHQVIVYDAGTRPRDIDTTNTTPSTGIPAGVALINDANHRLYRGLDPSRLHLVDPQGGSLGVRDRVEVVHFLKPGKYLVICGVHGHFVEDRMFGFVRVRSADEDDD